jgi:hypothetical protein
VDLRSSSIESLIIHGTPQLHTLILAWCVSLRFLQLNTPQLANFTTEGCSISSIQIASNRLEKLEIIGAEKSLSLHLSALTHLSFGKCSIEESFFELLCLQCPSLQSLSLSASKNIRNFNFQSKTLTNLHLSTLPNLTKFDLEGCPSLSAFSILWCNKADPNSIKSMMISHPIQSIHIGGLKSKDWTFSSDLLTCIRIENMMFLSQIQIRCINLTSLFLVNCAKLNTASLQCHKIRVLSVRSSRNLVNLQLDSFQKVNQKVIKAILISCPKLKSISFSQCTFRDANCLLPLAKSSFRLQNCLLVNPTNNELEADLKSLLRVTNIGGELRLEMQ